MNVNQKGKLISDFYDEFGSDPEFDNFFKRNDVGVQLALQSIANRTVNEAGYDVSNLDRFTSTQVDELLEQTWKDLCHWIGSADQDQDYETLKDLLGQTHPMIKTESEVLDAVKDQSLLGVFKLGRFASTPAETIYELCKRAFSVDEDMSKISSNLRVFIFGWTYEMGLSNCSCAKNPETKHDMRRASAESGLESLINLELNPNFDEIFRYLLAISLNYDPEFKILNKKQRKYLSSIHKDIPLFATNDDGSFRGDFFANDVRLVAELEKRDVSIGKYFEVFFNDFASRGDFLTNEGNGYDAPDEVPLEIAEFRFLCESGVIVEHEFYEWQHSVDYWYPKGLYLMAANRSNKFLSPLPESSDVNWNFAKAATSLPSELIEIFSLVPRIYVLSFCQPLVEIFTDCHSVLIDPMPAIIASRPETLDSRRVDKIASIFSNENGSFVKFFDEPLEEEGDDYTDQLELLGAVLHVDDTVTLENVAKSDSLLLKYAAFLNPALSEQTRSSLGIELDLGFSSKYLEKFLKNSRANLDDEFVELLEKLHPISFWEQHPNTGQENRMDSESKAQILAEFTRDNFTDEGYEEFFDYNDLGIPMAIAVGQGYVTLTDTGEELIDETWKELCELFGADPDETYDSIEDIYIA